MIYYLYKVTNKLNGKYYVGAHKTLDFNDGYMGSGKVIRNAIAKNGLSNFTKEILEQFDLPEEMYAREKEIVTDEFLKDKMTYNLRRGGTGGFDYINNNKLGDRTGAILSSDTKKKISKSRSGIPVSIETRENISRAQIGRIPWNKGKKIGPSSKEHKENLSSAITKWHKDRKRV